MRRAIAGLDRFLVTVEVAKHRFFRWAPAEVLPSGSLVVFARPDDFFLGVLDPEQAERTRLRNHYAAGDVIERRRRGRDGYAVIDAAAEIAVAPEVHVPAATGIEEQPVDVQNPPPNG